MRPPFTILEDIECTLRPLIEAEGGVLDVASDLSHAMQILATAPKSFRVVIIWDGYGGHQNAREGMAASRFSTFLHMNLGLSKDTGSKIYKTSIEGDAAFLERLETLSKWMRALRWPHGTDVDHAGMALADSDWVQDTPGKTKAHMLSWTLDQALAPYNTTLPIKIKPATYADPIR